MTDRRLRIAGTVLAGLWAVPLAALPVAADDGRDRNRQQNERDRARDHDQQPERWDQARARDDYHDRRPDVYYGAPPVIYDPPVYYGRPGANLNLTFPLVR